MDSDEKKGGSSSSSRSTSPIPTAKSLSLQDGYNQTYVIFKKDTATLATPGASSKSTSSTSEEFHEVFFRCGNWCYRGPIEFPGMDINVADLPTIIPTLQRQQGSLRYYCTAKKYAAPINTYLFCDHSSSKSSSIYYQFTP